MIQPGALEARYLSCDMPHALKSLGPTRLHRERRWSHCSDAPTLPALWDRMRELHIDIPLCYHTDRARPPPSSSASTSQPTPHFVLPCLRLYL